MRSNTHNGPQVFALRLERRGDNESAIRSMRQLLKTALRKHGWRCVAIKQEERRPQPAAPAAADTRRY
jgi:hypothetical protein